MRYEILCWPIHEEAYTNAHTHTQTQTQQPMQWDAFCEIFNFYFFRRRRKYSWYDKLQWFELVWSSTYLYNQICAISRRLQRQECFTQIIWIVDLVSVRLKRLWLPVSTLFVMVGPFWVSFIYWKTEFGWGTMLKFKRTAALELSLSHLF